MCITKLIYRFTKFSTAHVSFGKKRILVLVADSSLKMMVGLMHRDRLVNVDGMLFLPKREARHGIWMLNMKFSIDILWLSKSGVVVDAIEKAEPCTSLLGCETHKPRHDAFYILELGAGKTKELGLKVGSKIEISNINKPYDK